MAVSDAEFRFGIAGYILSVSRFLAPGTSYAVTTANCAIWLILYGIRQALNHSSQSDAPASARDTIIIQSRVAWVNGVGAVVELIYIAFFFKYSPADDQRRSPFLDPPAGGATAIIVAVVAFAVDDTFASIYCAACGFAVYAVPLCDVVNVLLNRRARYTPPLVIGAVSFCNGLVRCIFTGMRSDRYMFCPNLAGVVCAFVQLILHGIYWYKIGGCVDCEGQDDDPLDTQGVS